jgi:dTDP-4-dehydrorhamnose 3,5-epimerase
VIGSGHNFVATMARLAKSGVSPAVVSDQVGRLTFTSDLARVTRHLLDSQAPFGTYHVTGTGKPASWADIARAVFVAAGRDAKDVSDQSTADYSAGKLVSPRPASSVLAMDKLEATGFTMPDQWESLAAYLRDHL